MAADVVRFRRKPRDRASVSRDLNQVVIAALRGIHDNDGPAVLDYAARHLTIAVAAVLRQARGPTAVLELTDMIERLLEE